MESFPRFLLLVFLTRFVESEAAYIRRFPDLNGMPQSPERKMEEILQDLEMLTGNRLQEPQKPIDRRGYTEVLLKLVLQDISKHCALHYTISPVTKDAALNILNQILWQLEGDKKEKGEIMCASNLHSREMAKHGKELGEVQKDTSKDGDVVLVYTNDTIEKNVEGVLLSTFYGKHTPEEESQTQKLHVLYGNTEQISTTQNKSEQKWDAQDRLVKEQGADDGKQPGKKYTLKQILLLDFAIIFFVFSVILVVTFPTCWAIIHDRQKFTAKNMLEHSILQDDNGESGPKSEMETLQYVLKKTTSKPHSEGFQVILGKQRKSATEGHHKKIKKNQKVTLMKCPQHKAQKGVKNRGINEPTFAESWEDRRISYSDLPIAPPLPQESLWNYSDGLEQSFLKYNFSPSSDNSGLMASETGTMDEYTVQLGSLYPNSYSSQRSKEGTPAEASSPIVIHINSPHHSYQPCSQAVDINNTGNLSNGLTLDQSDVCTHGSITSPHWYSSIEANAVPTSPAQTMYPGADNSISGAATFSTPSPSTQAVSNEPVVYNYRRQTGVTSAGYVPGMFRSLNQTLLPHFDGGPTHIYGQRTQSLSPHTADKTQYITKPSICPQISCEKYKTKNNDVQLHKWSDCQKSKEATTSETFYVTDKRPASSAISMSVNHRSDRPDRERKNKFINNQQKLGLHSPRFIFKESIKSPNSYGESFKQDGIIPVTMASFIQPPPSYILRNLHTSNHASRSPSPLTDYELDLLYPNLHTTNLNSEEQDNTVQNDTQQPKLTKIPITRIIQVSQKRSHSYFEPLSVQHEADNQSSPRRSRSISPQKSYYSPEAGQSTHSVHTYCYNEALTYNLSPGYAADNVDHPSTSSAVVTDFDTVQSISNSITDTYNAEDAFNSLTGPVSCDAEDGSGRQGTSEYHSISAGLPPPTHNGHQIQQTSRHSESPYNTGNSGHESEFSIYSPWPHIEASIMNQASNDLLCTGVDNTSIKPLPICTAIPERISNFPGQPVSQAHESYCTTQSPSTCFQNIRQNTSNSNTLSGFPTVDNKAHLLCISNQSQPSNVENDRQDTLQVSFQSLDTTFRDEEAKSDNPNVNPKDDTQHSFKSPTRSLTSNVITTQHTRSPVPSHFNSDAYNTDTYSSDHMENCVQTIPNSSSNLTLNAANEHPSEFSNTPLNLNGSLPAAPYLLTQTQTTHGDRLSNNSHSSTQSQPLSANGVKENALCPSIQSTSSYTLANKEGRIGHSNQCSNSSASQGDSNKHNTSDTVLHMLDFNGTNDQDDGSNFHNYSLSSNVNVSVGAADNPPSNSPTGEDDSFLPNVPCTQTPSTSVDNIVEGVSYAFSQLMSTEFGESTQEIIQAFRSSSPSTHSHFLSNEEKDISSSSIHSLSVQVNDNTSDEFRSSPKSLNTCTDEISTSNAPMPCTQVLDNAHCICSSARSPLFLTQENAEGILIPSNHSQSTSATNCIQNTSHSMCQMPASHMSENIQDSTPSSILVCSNGEAVRDLSDPTSLNTQNNNIKGVPHFSAEIIPDNPGNRQCIMHEDGSVNPSHEVNSAATHSIHSQFNSPRNNPSPSESLISFNNDQQITSNFPTQLKQTNKTVIKQDSAYSSSQAVPSVHDKLSAISKASMYSSCTCIDPNKECRTNSSTPSLSSLNDNSLQRLPHTCNKTVGSNVADDIHYAVASSSQFTHEGSKQADQPATKSQHNFILITEDDRQDLTRTSRVSILTPASCGSHRSAETSSSSAHSARSKAESSPSSSVHPQSVPVCYSDSPKCSSIPSLSETEEGKQLVSDFSNHSQFTCTADNEQTAASSNPIKNRQGIFHSFTTNGRPVFRKHIQSPQLINENTPDTAKHDTILLPSNANEDETAFCLTSQPRSTQVNACAQDASFCLQPLSLYVNENLQNISPSLQILSTENASQSSSSRSQTSSVSSKQQTATYSFNAACNNLQCDSDTHIQSNLESTNFHGSSKQSNLTDSNLQGSVTESSTQCRSNLTDNNLQGTCETSTQSWLNQVSNNQQGGSKSLTESCSIPVGNRPKVFSCSFTQTRPISNDVQVTSCSSIDTDNRSDKLHDFRPSQYSHSPHVFYRVKHTSRFSARLSNSDHNANQDFLQSSSYLGEDQQTEPGVSTHRVKNVPGSSNRKYIDNSKQSPTRSCKFFHRGKVQGEHHSCTKPHCSNKQNKYRSCNQLQSKHTTKIKSQALCSSSLSPRCKCSTNLASNFSSTSSSSSSFPSSTSPDDSSGDWSLSNTSIFTVSSEYQSSASSSMLRSLSLRSDDAASCISEFTFSTLYDDDDDDDDILTAT